ncbi:unnamed protein product [Ilex paraguariensis]|uniref:Kri1-like C-terminal domain-containing protein n=1 Tax=Ilex paraguariensis TaxID=185542 RepID=A0ABC8RRW1_9AQUA
MGLKLFDGSGDVSEDDISKIEINKEYARRYEHNKKREDLQRFEELKKKGLIEHSSNSGSEESSDDSSEEDGLINSSKHDLEFFNALLKVRNQDPVLRNQQAKLFESEESESESVSENDDSKKDKIEARQDFKKGKNGKKVKKEKPMYLKDVVSKHLIEEGPEFEDTEDKKMGGVKSYGEEQEELRKAFLNAVEEGADEEGDLLKMKESRENEIEDGKGNGEIANKLDQYFGEDGKLDDNMKFLKDYFRNKMWVEEDKGGNRLDEEGLGFSEDEEEIDRQEDYEREFNFRFEENVGDRVMGHSRIVEGSVRKTTNARKLQRERKEERMAQAEFERKEELKHLKNLKKKDINEKLRTIRETAGIGEDEAFLLDEDDLEEEWDPEEHDRKMKEAFADDYYEADDVNPEFGSDSDGGELEKPDFDKEDELLKLPKGWDDEYGSGDGFLAVRERNLKRSLENDNGQIKVEEVPETSERKKKHKISTVEKAFRDDLMDEYYKLDYEDTIGDLQTRFKYKPVNAKRYGLSTEEIFTMDDKELNQYVSLKKLAPYKEKEWKVPRIKTFNQKQRNKALLEGVMSNVRKTGEKNSRGNGQKPATDVGATGIKKSQGEELVGDMGNHSRKSRRRHRQAELKLSHSRLMAYGKIPSKPKSKRK